MAAGRRWQNRSEEPLCPRSLILRLEARPTPTPSADARGHGERASAPSITRLDQLPLQREARCRTQLTETCVRQRRQGGHQAVAGGAGLHQRRVDPERDRRSPPHQAGPAAGGAPGSAGPGCQGEPSLHQRHVARQPCGVSCPIPEDWFILSYDLLESISPPVQVMATTDATRRRLVQDGEQLTGGMLRRVPCTRAAGEDRRHPDHGKGGAER